VRNYNEESSTGPIISQPNPRSGMREEDKKRWEEQKNEEKKIGPIKPMLV